MSILAEVTPTTAPVVPDDHLGATLFTIAMLVIATAFAWRMGVFRRGSIRGPVRIGRRFPLGSLIMVAGFGAFMWMAAQVPCVGSTDPKNFSALEYALLSTIPPIVGLIALLGGDRLIAQNTHLRLGVSLAKLPRGIGIAVVAMFIVLPVMFTAAVLLEWVYDLVGFKHPTEHGLLTVMKDAPLHLRALLTIGACTFVPAFEEVFFRGHLQTILIRLLRGVAASRWIAVIIVSVLFTVLHERWSWPLIFLLSLCLGYAYERTGNLWTAMLMHAIFNTTSTIIFLNR